MTTATTKTTTTITSKTTTIATKTKTTQPRINTAAECYLRVYIVVYAALQSWHSILERPEEAAAAWTYSRSTKCHHHHHRQNGPMPILFSPYILY